MENREDFHHDDFLDRAVDAVLRDPPPDELPPDEVAQLVAAIRQAAEQPYPITLIERINHMKSITKIAVTATVLIACVGLMSWLAPGSGSALAFDNVAEALNNVRSATWKTTSVVKGPKNETRTSNGIGMFLAPSHERMEITTRGMKEIGIFDGQKDKAIALIPASKTAIIMNFKNMTKGNPFGKTFQNVRKRVADAQSGKGGKVERLGVEVIDGRRAEGFRIRVGVTEVKIWADPKTLLPIRVEEASKPPIGHEVHSVMTDFQINADLDKSLFSLDVPAGYTVQKTIQIDASKKPSAIVAEALKMMAEYNDGVFPAALKGEQGIQSIMEREIAVLEKKYGKNSPELIKQIIKRYADKAPKLAGFFAVVSSLPPDAWHYAGKDVKLGTPNRPIFWFKTKKSTNYQVIYADLSVKELPVEELPKVPQAEGDAKP